MTSAEFKNKFKCGDKVYSIYTENDNLVELKITYIGINCFVCIDKLNIERLFSQEYDWVKIEPEKKPSEQINEIFHTLTPQTDDRWCINKFMAWSIWLDENWPKVVKK